MKIKVTATPAQLKGRGLCSGLNKKTFPKAKDNGDGTCTVTDKLNAKWLLPEGYFEEVK